MLRVHLLGALRLELDARPLAPVATRQARSLLAWLIVHPGLNPRTRVASVFWPDVLETSARASLRTALATLKREAGPEVAAHIVADRERVGIERGQGISVDLWDIRGLIAAGQEEQALRLADGRHLADRHPLTE